MASNPASNYFLGELYVQDGQLEKGIDYLKTALQLGSAFAPAEAALGYAIRLQAENLPDINTRDRHYAQAEERLLRALKMDTAVLDIYGESVHGRLGGLYKRQGRIDKAIFHYEEAWKVTHQVVSGDESGTAVFHAGENRTSLGVLSAGSYDCQS